jgi:aminopeptidase N
MTAPDVPTGGTTPTAPTDNPGPTTGPPTDVSSDPVAGGSGIGDEYYTGLGNTGYDVEHYRLELDFDPATDFLDARATITAVAGTALSSFNLDFDRLSVDGLTVNGSEADFTLTNEELTITPTEPLAAGAEFVVEVEYSGMPGPTETPALSFSMGWFNNLADQTFVVAEPDAAHTWFPSNDHPLDKATYEFEITVPSGVTAAANGRLVSSQLDSDGHTTWQWEMDDPMASYLATLVIGEFDIVVDDRASADAGLPIRHVLPRGTGVGDWPGLERQGEMLAFLEDLFGPYPFDNYGIAIVEEFPAALENQTLSVFGTRMTGPEIFDRVLIHELAHQWFGNSVSPAQWSDVWLNEGFASYAEWLWFENETGRAVLDTSIEAERAEFATFGLPPPGTPPPTDLFNGSVYRIGAMTLHALRLTVGDDTFFEILRTYHTQFRGGAATTEDFIAVAEGVSGEDLGDLFGDWLFGFEVPEFPG